MFSILADVYDAPAVLLGKEGEEIAIIKAEAQTARIQYFFTAHFYDAPEFPKIFSCYSRTHSNTSGVISFYYQFEKCR